MLRAIDRPTIDHRGPQFAALGAEVLTRIRRVFQTAQPVVIYPASGTGAWEAALVNTLSPGDVVLMAETGRFALLWKDWPSAWVWCPNFFRRLAAWRRSGYPRAPRR